MTMAQNLKDSIKVTAQFLKLKGHYADAEEILSLVEKLERAIDALQYYADISNHLSDNDKPLSDIEIDRGFYAKITLEMINGIE